MCKGRKVAKGRNERRALKWQDITLGMVELDLHVGSASLPEKGTL